MPHSIHGFNALKGRIVTEMPWWFRLGTLRLCVCVWINYKPSSAPMHYHASWPYELPGWAHLPTCPCDLMVMGACKWKCFRLGHAVHPVCYSANLSLSIQAKQKKHVTPCETQNQSPTFDITTFSYWFQNQNLVFRNNLWQTGFSGRVFTLAIP